MSDYLNSYSHGFLFPSTIEKVRMENATGLSPNTLALRGGSEIASAYSSVTTFGSKYRPLHTDLSANEQVEALIEGSPLSLLRNDPSSTDYATYSKSKSSSGMKRLIENAYGRKQNRRDRYLGDEEEKGGTVVVHYIKKQEWFVETMIALLGSGEEQGLEKERGEVGVGLGMLEWGKSSPSSRSNRKSKDMENGE